MNKISSSNKFKISKNMKTILINIVATVVIIAISLVAINRPKEIETIANKPDFSEVTKIGELATLKCFYHNVADYEKQPDGLFQYGLFQVGYKKFWIEYTGTVEIGIDISKVKISQPQEDGSVRVYVPEVEIFRLNQDSTSVKDPIFEKGKFTTITTEEKSVALSEAQKKMEETARADQVRIQRARENAKTLIKQYITNVGITIGQEYNVVWVDTPEEVNENAVIGGIENE